jgi:hypothetical protein
MDIEASIAFVFNAKPQRGEAATKEDRQGNMVPENGCSLAGFHCVIASLR